MRGILLISHGQFAEGLKESVKMIAGETTNVYTTCLAPEDGPDQFREKLLVATKELDKYDDVVVFADLFGGSPCNGTFVECFQNPKYNFIAGMNFPMVLTAILSPEESIANLIQTGQEGIVDVRKIMAAMNSDDE